MALKCVTRNLPIIHNFARNYSAGSSGPLVNVAVDEKSGVSTVTMQRPPVNSLNLELLTELLKTLTDLEKNKSRGMILTSSSNSVFSAGLDIFEMYKPDVSRFTQWWSTLQETWMKLYGSPYPTVAVINGHAPAGGCLLAMSCEYRIMMNNFTIGLNETKLGIVAPKWFIASMKNTIGNRQTEVALTTGNLFTTDEALKIGLVDEVAASKEDGIARAEKFLQRFAKIPPHARSFTKTALRGADIQDLADSQEQELQLVLATVAQDKVQKSLGVYLEALKQRQKQ